MNYRQLLEREALYFRQAELLVKKREDWTPADLEASDKIMQGIAEIHQLIKGCPHIIRDGSASIH